METSRPASRSPASAAPTCRKSTEPMYESLVTLRRAHQLSARRASMTLCHGCDPRGAREWCGRWSKAHNRRSAIVRIPTGDPTSWMDACFQSSIFVPTPVPPRIDNRCPSAKLGHQGWPGTSVGFWPKHPLDVILSQNGPQKRVLRRKLGLETVSSGSENFASSAHYHPMGC